MPEFDPSWYSPVPKCAAYFIRNRRNGKVYVGSSCKAWVRRRQHRLSLERGTHHNCHLQAAFLKHGRDAFVFEIVESRPPGSPKHEMDTLEQVWMQRMGVGDHSRCYNMSTRADRLEITPEIRLKMSISAKARIRLPLSEETKEKIRQKHNKPVYQFDRSGNLLRRWDSSRLAAGTLEITEGNICGVACRKQHNNTAGGFIWSFTPEVSEEAVERATREGLTDEHKAKLSAAFLGRFVSDETRRKMALASTGRRLSDEAKRKISEQNTGRRRTDEQRRAMSLRQTGRKQPPAERAKRQGARNGHAKPIYQYTPEGAFVRRWDYMQQAAAALGIGGSDISVVASGRQKSAGGFVWGYASWRRDIFYFCLRRRLPAACPPPEHLRE